MKQKEKKPIFPTIKNFLNRVLSALKKYDVYISAAAAAVSSAILVTGYVWIDYNLMLTAVVILWTFSVLNSLIRFKDRFFLLFFQLAMFLF